MIADTVRSFAPYLSSWLDYQVWCQRIPGLQVAIRVDQDVVYSAGHGFADVERGEKMTPEHLLHIASHSKTFAAVAVQKLADEGKLSFEDTVGQHVAQCRGTWAEHVTVRELSSHTSGMIRDGRACDHWSLLNPFPDSAELLRVVKEEGKQVERRQFFKYSNIAFGLLGQVIAAAAGKTFDEYVHEAVVAPLGLTDTFPDYTPELAHRCATPYGQQRGADYERCVFDQAATNSLAAATGFVSTALDTSAFYASLRPGNAGVLSDVQKYELARIHGMVSRGPDTVHYGLGVMASESHGRKMVGHSGGWTGTLSRTAVDFEDGLVVSVIGNCIDAPVIPIFKAILGFVKVFGDTAAQEPTPEGVDLDAFAGRYENPWGVRDVVRCGNHLVTLDPGTLTPEIETLRVLDQHTTRLKDADTFGANCEDILFGVDSGQGWLRMSGEKQVRVAQW